MKKLVMELPDSVGFMIPMSLIGGFLDAYTYLTRGGVFANTQTTNMAKLGISLANGNWTAAAACVYPMIGCILGAMAAHWLKDKSAGAKQGTWHKRLMLVELIVLFVVGFIPSSVPHLVVNLTIAFIASFQLTGYKTLEGKTCNTTICTGNTRTVGQYLYEAIIKRDPEAVKKFAKFSCTVYSFALGALISAASSMLMGVRAIWICCAILAVLIFRLANAPEEQPIPIGLIGAEKTQRDFSKQ